MYGAAERIHWTNARVVAEWTGGAAFGFGGIDAAAGDGRRVSECADYNAATPYNCGRAT